MADLPAADPVMRGIAYGARLQAKDTVRNLPVFPQGSRLLAQVREYVGARDLLAELTFENGGLTRVNDDTIDIRISKTATKAIGNTSVSLDFVRFDVNPELYLYIRIELPVLEPVTWRLP